VERNLVPICVARCCCPAPPLHAEVIFGSRATPLPLFVTTSACGFALLVVRL
jgi:hypothetical protein